MLPDADAPGVVVKPERAGQQLDAESTKPATPGETQPNGQGPAVPGGEPEPKSTSPDPPAATSAEALPWDGLARCHTGRA